MDLHLDYTKQQERAGAWKNGSKKCNNKVRSDISQEEAGKGIGKGKEKGRRKRILELQLAKQLEVICAGDSGHHLLFRI